jgi:hypothetical protein
LMSDVAVVDTLSWRSWEDYNVRSLMRHFFLIWATTPRGFIVTTYRHYEERTFQAR